MAETIRRNRALTELSLYGNAIGVAGGRAIADAIRVNATLRALDLRENGFDTYTESALLQTAGGRVILEEEAARAPPSVPYSPNNAAASPSLLRHPPGWGGGAPGSPTLGASASALGGGYAAYPPPGREGAGVRFGWSDGA
eukprot:1862046-Prymnesium_polylepis.1